MAVRPLRGITRRYPSSLWCKDRMPRSRCRDWSASRWPRRSRSRQKQDTGNDVVSEETVKRCGLSDSFNHTMESGVTNWLNARARSPATTCCPLVGCRALPPTSSKLSFGHSILQSELSKGFSMNSQPSPALGPPGARRTGNRESAGVNRHVVWDERALQEGGAANPSWP